MRALLLVLLACGGCSTLDDIEIPVSETALVSQALSEALQEADKDENGVITKNEWIALVTVFAAKVVARWGKDD